MKGTRTRLLSILLAALLLAGLLPLGNATAYADAVYPVWVGDTQVTEANQDDILADGGTAKYDPDSKTLTLNDTTAARIYAELALTVELLGSNTLNGPSSYGIQANSLTIKGEGSLEISGCTEEGIAGDDITINDGTVEVTSEGVGIHAHDGDFTVTGGKVTVSATEKQAIVADNITVSDGEVSAESTDAQAIFAVESITVSGDSTKLTGKSENGSYGVYAGGSVTVDGGALEGESQSCGIYGDGGITMAATHAVTLPAGGNLSSDGKTVAEADGSTVAAHAVIAPGTSTVSLNVTVFTVDAELNAVSETGGTAALSKTEAGLGEEVTVTATPAEGFELYRIGYGDGTTQDDITAAGKFTVEAGKGQVEVTFRKKAVYTVSFDSNGGTGTMDDVTVTEGEKLTLPDCGFTAPEGKEFDQWDLGEVGEQVDITADSVVRATWKNRTTFTVTFDGAGGTPATQTLETGADGKLGATDLDGVSATVKREGYEFVGWAKTANGAAFAIGEEVFTEDTTVYAVWKQSIVYTVTKGADNAWKKSSKIPFSLTVKRSVDDNTCFSHFVSVSIDGNVLTKNTDYTAKSGSTIISLRAATLQKLSVGVHEITVNFDDGAASTHITIRSNTTSAAAGGKVNTGDAAMPIWALLLVCLASGAGVLVTYKLHRKYN